MSRGLRLNNSKPGSGITAANRTPPGSGERVAVVVGRGTARSSGAGAGRSRGGKPDREGRASIARQDPTSPEQIHGIRSRGSGYGDRHDHPVRGRFPPGWCGNRFQRINGANLGRNRSPRRLQGGFHRTIRCPPVNNARALRTKKPAPAVRAEAGLAGMAPMDRTKTVRSESAAQDVVRAGGSLAHAHLSAGHGLLGIHATEVAAALVHPPDHDRGGDRDGGIGAHEHAEG